MGSSQCQQDPILDPKDGPEASATSVTHADRYAWSRPGALIRSAAAADSSICAFVACLSSRRHLSSPPPCCGVSSRDSPRPILTVEHQNTPAEAYEGYPVNTVQGRKERNVQHSNWCNAAQGSEFRNTGIDYVASEEFYRFKRMRIVMNLRTNCFTIRPKRRSFGDFAKPYHIWSN